MRLNKQQKPAAHHSFCRWRSWGEIWPAVASEARPRTPNDIMDTSALRMRDLPSFPITPPPRDSKSGEQGAARFPPVAPAQTCVDAFADAAASEIQSCFQFRHRAADQDRWCVARP